MPRITTPADVTEFRNRLCEVAAQLFAEKGYEGFNMRELAGRLGISTMTPYRYFKDKEAILSEVRARAFSRFADWLEKHLSAPNVDDDTLSYAYAQYAVQQQSQYRLMFDMIQPAASILPAQVAQEDRVRKILVDHMHFLVARDLISGDPELLSLVLWSVLHGTTALYLASKVSSRDFDGALSGAVKLFFSAHSFDAKALPLNLNFGDDQAPWWKMKTLEQA